MNDWLRGPLNNNLCEVYEGRMMTCIFPKGLVIGKLEAVAHQHQKRFFIVSKPESEDTTWHAVDHLVAYKVMMP